MQLNNDSLKELIAKVLVIISLTYIYFFHFSFIAEIMNRHILYLILICPFIFLIGLTMIGKIRINWYNLFVFFYLILMVISLYRTNFRAEAIDYFLFFLIIIIVQYYLMQLNNWQDLFFNLTFSFSGFHVFFILLNSIIPKFTQFLSSKLLTQEEYLLIFRLNNEGYMTGITNQAAISGMFSIVFVMVTVSRIFTYKNKRIFYLAMMVLGFVSLLLTQKRSFLLAAAAAIVFIVFILNKDGNKKRSIRIWILGSITIVTGILFFDYLRSKFSIIDRFFSEEDLFRSRRGMYDTLLNWYNENKLFGTGIGAAQGTFGYGGHNIYLQHLGEMGILGLIGFSVSIGGLIIYNTYKSIKIINTNKISLKNQQILLFTIAMQVVFILYGFSGNPIYDYSFLTMLIFIISIPYKIILSTKERSA